MAYQETFLDWLHSDPGKAAIAGALGGVVRWITLRSSWKEGIGTLIVGAICAIYLGPFALPIFEGTIGRIVPNGDTNGLSAFLCGISGIGLSGFVLDVIKRKRRDIGGDPDEK